MGTGKGACALAEKNQFTDSNPVDDSEFRLTDGNWEDFAPWTTASGTQTKKEPQKLQQNPASSEPEYEDEMVHI